MSRAFAKEDDGREEPEERPQPSGPNYVTPTGLALLREKVLALEAEHRRDPAKDQKDLRYWRARLATSILVDNARRPPADVRFGARVLLKDEKGRRREVRIVGQDEADGEGLISWDSALAYALSGKTAGEETRWDDGERERRLTVVSLRYD